ncbi:hypothetical protein [Clostridium estertheticum]|uniref:hypothetical protein n=1 Tax=Clostridium estertheticum TaxID=238834 RepID=UPI001CF10D29|nr:hypothetical protein [Clostridium estertheticum]MCB2359092.1 hypothetical protein [Clostridium estertheticum]
MAEVIKIYEKSIMMSACNINFKINLEESKIDITATTKTIGKIEIKMESLTRYKYNK